jgi:hypothetical protein
VALVACGQERRSCLEVLVAEGLEIEERHAPTLPLMT